MADSGVGAVSSNVNTQNENEGVTSSDLNSNDSVHKGNCYFFALLFISRIPQFPLWQLFVYIE